MLEPLTERQKTLIVNNVVKAVKNINSLNKTGYKYLYLCSGFIAHYDLYGFIDFYSYVSLKNDIIGFANQNQWKNFRPGERDYEYYQSKADVYARILEQIA
jgi:hypothetical protein